MSTGAFPFIDPGEPPTRRGRPGNPANVQNGNGLEKLINRLADKFAKLEAAINKLIALHRSLLERFARQGEVLDGTHPRLDSLEKVMSEWVEESGRNADRIDNSLTQIKQVLLLILGKQEQSPAGRKMYDTLQIDQEKMHLMKMLATQTRNLHRLREREVRYGGNAPVDLLNQIEETELSILHIKEELDND